LERGVTESSQSPIPFGQRTRTLLEFLISPRNYEIIHCEQRISEEFVMNGGLYVGTRICRLSYINFTFSGTGDRQLRRHRAAKDVAKGSWLDVCGYKVADVDTIPIPIPVPRPCPIIMLEGE